MDFTQTILDELNLDDIGSNKATITNLVAQAKAIINHSFQQVDQQVLDADPVYQRAVITLVFDLFVNRSLDTGLNNGLQMMMNVLGGKYGK